MKLVKCLVPVLALLLVEGSSARPAGGQQPGLTAQNGASIVYGNGNVTSIGIFNARSSGTFKIPSFGGYSVRNGNAAANAEATAIVNSETISGSTGKIKAQNPLHVEGPQAAGVNGNGQGNGHPDGLVQYLSKGETSAYANAGAIASSPSKVNHFQGQWIFVPFEAASAGGGAVPSTFGGYGPAYGSRVPGANSASNAVANAGSSGVGGFGGNAGNNGIISSGSVFSGSGLAGYGGSNGGFFGANAKVHAVPTAGSDGSIAYRQGSSGGLFSAISNANSNASGRSTSSSSKSTANGSGNAMAQSSSNAISTDGKSSASSYASASACTNV